MSATARSARASTRPAGRPTPSTAGRPRRTPLREVPPPAVAVAGKGIFALVVLGILVAGMVMLLVLNTSLAQGAFEIGALSKQQRDLAVSEQTLLQQVARAEAPEALQYRAHQLGMVPVSSPVFLRLADGKVLGVPEPAQAAPYSGLPVTGRQGSAVPPSTTAPGTTTPGTTTPGTTLPSSATAAAAPAKTAVAQPTGDAAVADLEVQSDAALPDVAAPPVTARGN